MRIKLIAEMASDRLLWQHRILYHQKEVSFRLLSQEQGMISDQENVVVWVISTYSEYEKVLLFTEKSTYKGNLLLVLSLELERKLSSDELDGFKERCTVCADEVLLESDYSAEVLFQRLFKPRTKQQQAFAKVHSSIAAEETVLICQAPEESRIPLMRQFQSRWRLFSLKNRTPDKTPAPKSFPRMKLCVYGQSALAYELAAVIASSEGVQVLVMDLDRLAPSADVFMGVKPMLPQAYEFFTKVSATGLNVLLDCAKKGAIQRETFIKCTQALKAFPSCHVLTGVYQMTDYEYYKTEDLTLLIDKAASYYDVVILKTNKYAYDGFTLMAMHMADIIISGLPPAIEEIRAHHQLILLLQEKQRISIEKQAWVLFEEEPIGTLEIGFIESLTRGNYLGNISKLAERQKCALTGEGYLKKKYATLNQVYTPLLRRIQQQAETI